MIGSRYPLLDEDAVVEDDVPDDGGVWMSGRLSAVDEGRTWE